MAPNSKSIGNEISSDIILNERLIDTDNILEKSEPTIIVWRNVAIFTVLHSIALTGLYQLITGQVMWQTVAWVAVFYCMAIFGVGAGVHRLWAHRSYKARFPLRVILMIFNTVAFQNSIFEWARDHRVHHKYSETNADPHNAKRGFFYSHIGWLLSKKHSAVKIKGRGIDISDLEEDSVVMFQKKYFVLLGFIITLLIPTVVPIYFWGEDHFVAYCSAIFRYIAMLHVTWCVNSVAHLVGGQKPYDKTINPREVKWVSIFAFGEGWHNYHHVFPWDYKTAEVGIYRYNLSTAFIDFFAKIGWAYDLKTVSKNIVMQRINKFGDGSHSSHNHAHSKHNSWGWIDKNTREKEKKITEIHFQKNE